MNNRHTQSSLGRRPLAAVAVGVTGTLIAAAGCAPDPEAAAGAGASPTFEKVEFDGFQYPEPVAAVNDLLPPTEAGEPWYIIGSVLDPGTGRTQGSVWTSADGRSWDEGRVDQTDRQVSEQMQAATYHDGELLVVGSVGQADDADAALWTGDGTNWTQSTPEALGGDHEQWAFEVVTGDGGTLIAGGERVWGEIRPRLWHSPDGAAWTEVSGGPEGPFDQSGQESITDIAAFGNGFVAVGWERTDGVEHGVAWHSADGVSWEKLDTPTMAGDARQAVMSVATVGDTVVAGGYRADGIGQSQPVTWRSSDGTNWSDASAPLPLHEGTFSTASDLRVRSISVSGDTVIASGGARFRPQVWRSQDAGQTWEQLPAISTNLFGSGLDIVTAAAPPSGGPAVAIGSEPLVATVSDGRWVNAGGDTFPNGGRRPVATSVIIDGEATYIGGYHLIPQQGDNDRRYQAHVWRRQGNGDFTTIGPDEEDANQGFDAGAIFDLTATEQGYIAVGVEDFATASTRSQDDRSPDGILWASEDGSTWRRRASHRTQIDAEEMADELFDTVSDEAGDIDTDAVAGAAISILADEPMLTHSPAGGGGTRALTGVAPLGQSFISVGAKYEGEHTDSIAVRGAPEDRLEGENPLLDGPGTQRFNDICTSGDRSIAVGIDEGDSGYRAAVRLRQNDQWTEATAADGSFESNGNVSGLACAASDDGFLMVGTDDSGGNLDAKVWSSEDGLTWEEVTSGSFGGTGSQEATAVAAVPGGGWLIAGTDTSGAEAGIALWRLDADGEISRRDHGEAALRGPVPMGVSDLAVSGNRAVIVGTDVEGIGVWETENLDR